MSNLEEADFDRLKLANKALRKLKYDADMSLLFKPFPCNANLIMLIYTDASFQNVSCGGSQGAYFIMIYDLKRKKKTKKPKNWLQLLLQYVILH